METDMTNTIPDWLTYPEEEWETITPEEAGFDCKRWQEILRKATVYKQEWEGETIGEQDWGSVITRGGYKVHSWGNDKAYVQTASVGKAFTRALVGLAAKAKLINADDEIWKTWTGEGLLSHPHKVLNQGHHKSLTWRHLIGPKDKYEHWGGFPVTNGFQWRNKQEGKVPDWAKWTGDPGFDNYAHAQPGTVRIYSSGGIWRLAQSLTVLWNKDLKDVLDERLFGKIGIPANRWDWLPGKMVHDQKDFYPHMPGYGDFLDPPFEINGHKVRGGGGWAVMTPSDMARFGLLVATGGIWKGERIVDEEWVRNHHGGNGSYLAGAGKQFTSFAKTCCYNDIPFPLPDDLFVGPVRK